LNITRIDKKQAATNLLAVGTFTKSTSASPASNDTFNTTNGTWTNSDLAEQAAIVVIDIKAEDLDIANGFDCVSMTIADVGTNAQLGTAIAILWDPRNSKSPLESAIVD
jgi:glucokinase